MLIDTCVFPLICSFDGLTCKGDKCFDSNGRAIWVVRVASGFSAIADLATQKLIKGLDQ